MQFRAEEGEIRAVQMLFRRTNARLLELGV